jgi:hypothetical protein
LKFWLDGLRFRFAILVCLIKKCKSGTTRRSRTGAPCNKGVGDIGTGPNSRTEQNRRTTYPGILLYSSNVKYKGERFSYRRRENTVMVVLCRGTAAGRARSDRSDERRAAAAHPQRTLVKRTAETAARRSLQRTFHTQNNGGQQVIRPALRMEDAKIHPQAL